MRIKDSPNKISFYTKPKTVPFSLLSKVYKSQQNITGKYCGTPCILKECNFRATIGALVYQESLPERSFPIFTRSSVYLIKYVVKLMKLCTSHSAPNLLFFQFYLGFIHHWEEEIKLNSPILSINVKYSELLSDDTDVKMN